MLGHDTSCWLKFTNGSSSSALGLERIPPEEGVNIDKRAIPCDRGRFARDAEAEKDSVWNI